MAHLARSHLSIKIELVGTQLPHACLRSGSEMGLARRTGGGNALDGVPRYTRQHTLRRHLPQYSLPRSVIIRSTCKQVEDSTPSCRQLCLAQWCLRVIDDRVAQFVGRQRFLRLQLVIEDCEVGI